MANEKILRRWKHLGVECYLWTEAGADFHGAVEVGGTVVANLRQHPDYGENASARSLEALATVLRRGPGPWDVTHEGATDFIMVDLPAQLDTTNVDRPTSAVRIADDLLVIPVSRELEEISRLVCDPPGLSGGESIDLRGPPLYAFARLKALPAESHSWDFLGRLKICIALSRLVRPTSISFRYAVRVVGDLGSARTAAYPGPVREFGAQAFTATPQEDWLTADDLRSLRSIVQAWDKSPFPHGGRLRRALWFFEYACRTEFTEIRVPLIANAIESLLLTTADGSSRQFKTRVVLLASQLGIPDIEHPAASKMWSLRSKMTHGSIANIMNEKDGPTYKAMEDLLRRCLLRCVTNGAFRKQFDSDDAVEKAFPVPAKEPKVVTCPNCRQDVEV